MANLRADELLVKLGLVETRSKARALILEGKVAYSNGSLVEKPGKKLAEDTALTVTQPMRFVGRGGEKLEGFLEQFHIDVRHQHSLDVGASTGGFTDCLLQRGITTATCVDVGHGQLHPSLESNPAVTSFEGINARHLPECTTLPRETFDIVVMDLSFISLKPILPAVWPRVAQGGHMIALVKPQFEATKEEATKTQGIIKDPAVHTRILNEIETAASQLPGIQLIGQMDSPIKGGDGNQEYLMGWRKK